MIKSYDYGLFFKISIRKNFLEILTLLILYVH